MIRAQFDRQTLYMGIGLRDAAILEFALFTPWFEPS